LKTGDKGKAKEHAKAASEHTKSAADKNDELVLIYEIWEY
jgi:hypothetical protein